MNRRSRTFILGVLTAATVILTAGPALAQPPIPLRMSTRAQAMGGANLLSAGPIDAGFFNPAALTMNKGLHVTAAFQMAFNEDFANLAEFITDNADYFDPTEFANLYATDQAAAERFRSDLADYTSRWYTLNIDPLLGIQVGALSLSGYSAIRANIRPFVPPVVPPAIPDTPELQSQVAVDNVVNAALGMQVGKMLRGGVSLRLLQRQYSDVLTVDPEDLDATSGFTTQLADKDNWLDDPLTGFQVDVGGMVTLSKALAAGGVIRGLVSGGDDEITRGWEPELSGGIMFKPLEVLMGIPKILIKDITLEANIRDLTNVRGEAYGDLMERVQIGAEVKVPFFQLRAGLNRGQLSAGAGFRFLILDISAAVSTITDFELDPTLGMYNPIEKRYFSVAAAIGF